MNDKGFYPLRDVEDILINKEKKLQEKREKTKKAV